MPLRATPLLGPEGRQVAQLLTLRPLPEMTALLLWAPLLVLAGLAVLLVLDTARLLRSVHDAVALLTAGTAPESRSRDNAVHSLQSAVEAVARNARRVEEISLQASRRQQRQERLIRAEIRKLAGALDRQGRAEMLRLSDRIEQQHLRLTELVAELCEALVTRARLARLEHQLSITGDMQLAMVPEGFAPIAGHQIAGRMIAGERVPAARFMAISCSLLRDRPLRVGLRGLCCLRQ